MNTKTLAALLAATALTSVSAYAGPVKFTGDLYVGMASSTSDNSDLDDTEPTTLGGKGSLYLPFNNTKLSATFDAFVQQDWDIDDDGDDESGSTSYGAAAHFTYAEKGRYQLGIFASAFNVELIDDEEDWWYSSFGAEGKFLFERAALYAQAGFIDEMNRCDDCFEDPFQEIGFARVGVNYYPEDDLKLTGEIGLYGGTNGPDSDDSLDLTQYSVAIEKQFASKFSIYANYVYSNFDNISGDDYWNQHAVTVGVRVRLGEGADGTLRSHEETNSLGTPNLSQLIAGSDEID